MGVAIVRRCPGCGHLHLHRAASLAAADGASRAGSCGTEYVLLVRPAVVPAPAGWWSA